MAVSVQVNVRLTPDLAERLRRLSEAMQISRGAIVRVAVAEYVRKQGGK